MNWARSKVVVPATIVALASIISFTVAEFGARYMIGNLPDALLVFLHRDLRQKFPEVTTRLQELNPWATGRQRDDQVGWTHLPNHREHGKNEDGEPYDRTSSAEGFYTPSVPARETRQLIMIGDSFVSTFYVKEPMTWVAERLLKLPVYVAAAGGWGPDNYREVFNKFGRGRNAPVVAVYTFANDISDVENWNRWTAGGRTQPFVDWIWENNPQKEIINNSGRWFDRHSVIYNWLHLIELRTARKLAQAKSAQAAPDPLKGPVTMTLAGHEMTFQLEPSWPFLIEEPSVFYPGGVNYPSMQAYFDSLLSVNAAIEAAGSTMVLFWIPTKERVYIPLMSEDMRRHFVKNKSGNIGFYEEMLNKFAADNHIKYVDLTAPLTKLARSGEKLYFTNDGHLNSLGHLRVGEISVEVIRPVLQAH